MVTYLMTVEEQNSFDPVTFTQNLKAAGFKFDNDICPIKIKKPWDKVRLESGAVLWRQWEK